MQLAAGALTELMPQAGGRCYVMRASRDHLESIRIFGTPVLETTDMLAPDGCWALRRNQSHRCGPGTPAPRCAHVLDATGASAWSLCVPLAAHGIALGLLHVQGQHGEDAVPELLESAETVAEQLSQAVANLQLRESLRLQSLRDPLTGLYNRRYLEENLAREIHRCARHALPLAVMMLDVDHFKRFNDTHGHAAGDAVLAKVAEVMVSATRGEDMACRYGGEEFTLVLSDASRATALQRAERLRAAVAALTIQYARRTLDPVSISIGVALFPEDGDTPDQLINAADRALYRAKHAGRDRVVAAA